MASRPKQRCSSGLFRCGANRIGLPAALAEMAGRLGTPRAMGITMTAELADCFATKRQGVAFVLDAFRTAFPAVQPSVYGVDGRFHSVDEAKARPLLIAAANWRASATLVARSFPDVIFLDAGSTTTDIIPIVSGPGRCAWTNRSGTASERRARLHRCAPHAGLRHRAVSAISRPPLPRRRGTFRHRRRCASLARTNRRRRLQL